MEITPTTVNASPYGKGYTPTTGRHDTLPALKYPMVTADGTPAKQRVHDSALHALQHRPRRRDAAAHLQSPRSPLARQVRKQAPHRNRPNHAPR